MIDSYRRFPLKYQLLSWFVLVVLAFLLGSQTEEVWLITGGVAVGLLLLHWFLVKLNSLLAFIIISFQGFIYVSITVAAHIYWEDLDSYTTLDLQFLSALIVLYGMTSIASYVYLAYRTSRGRLWLNLLTAFILQNFITLTIIGFYPLFYLAGMAAGFLSGATYLVLRAPRLSSRPAPEPVLVSADIKTKTGMMLQEAGYQKVWLPSTDSTLEGNWLGVSDKNVLIVTVVKPYKSFSVTPSQIEVDGKNLLPLLEATHQSIHATRKMVPAGAVTHVLLVMADFKNIHPVMTVNVSAWKQPDYTVGQTVILTRNGWGRFNRALLAEGNSLSSGTREKAMKYLNRLQEDSDADNL